MLGLMRGLLAGLLGLCLQLAVTGAAQAEKRVALVIGNSAYKSVPRLDNPQNDANLIGKALTANGFAVTGAPTITCDISTSPDGTTYTLNAGVWQVYSTNFRYVKFRVTVQAPDTTSLYKLTGANVRLDVKLKNDGGTVACNASDVNGTTATFVVPFISVTSITLTAAGTTPLTAVYNFSGAPNPTGFSIYLFNSSGQRVSGNVSWSAKGY